MQVTSATAWMVDQDVPAGTLKAYSPIADADNGACVNCRKRTRTQLWLWWTNNPRQQRRFFVCFGCTDLAQAFLLADGWTLVRMVKPTARGPMRPYSG